jgi:hypothetical protein
MTRFWSAILLAVTVALTGCMSGKPTESAPSATTAKKGQFGSYYYVNLFTPPVGGVITSSETTPRINCGASSLGKPKADADGVLQYDPVFYPGASSCGDAQGQTQYQWGDTVVLTAAASTGYTFYGWAGDCSGSGACTLTAGADKTVVAVFTNGTSWNLTVAKFGTGAGTITATIPGHPTISCGFEQGLCTFAVPIANPPTVVTLTPSADAASHFSGWGQGPCTGTNACTVPVGAPAVIAAAFDTGPSTAPVIGSFGATPESVEAGQSATLSWSVTGATSLSIDQGVGPVAGTSVTVAPFATTTYLLSATNASGTTTRAATVTVTPPPVALQFVLQPAGRMAGDSLPTIQVRVVDGTGHTVLSGTHNVTLAVGSGAALHGTTTAATVNGEATFTGLSVTAAGLDLFLVASAPGLGSATSSPFSVWAASPSVAGSTVGVVAPVVVATSPVQVNVHVVDVFGNDCAGVPLSLAFTGATNVTSNAGVAGQDGRITPSPFPVSIGKAGNYSLTVSAGGVFLAPATFTVVVGAPSPSGSTLTPLPSMASADGSTVTLTVALVDNAANPIPGSIVTFSASGPATIVQPAAPTDAAGVASGSISTTTPGSLIVTASVGGVAVKAVSVGFGYTIGGTVTGLVGSGLSIGASGQVGMVLPAGTTTFGFGNPLLVGTAYEVSIFTQPSGPAQICSITNGSGSVNSATPTNVAITCVMNAFTVGGTITGLQGSGLTLATPGAASLVVPAGATTFAFASSLPGGAPYAVTVSQQPTNPPQTCSVASGAGTIPNAAVTNVQVTCVEGTFAATGGMTVGRTGHVATLLPSGRVLLAGGGGDSGHLASAELYDPATGAFAVTGSMNSPRRYATATLLPSGLVLVAGGEGVVSGASLASAELYNPATGTFTATGSMATPRKYATATLLPNGFVLVAGGWNANASGSGPILASAELYNPATGSFTATGTMAMSHEFHAATLLSTGRVLISGGDLVGSGAELYDPVTGTFTLTGNMITPRMTHTATRLPSGLVLIAGGQNSNSGPQRGAEIYDPITETFTATGSMTSERDYFTATLLPNGLVLVAGGADTAAGGLRGVSTAEVFDPATGTFAPTEGMIAARTRHTATLLPSGRVLVAGSMAVPNILSSAELYSPVGNGARAGTFVLTGQMVSGRGGHDEATVVRLANGKVLIAGGGQTVPLASAEVYDPVTGAFSSTSPMAAVRTKFTATLLPNGRVLIAGGASGGFNGPSTNSAELYDPVTRAFTPTGSLIWARQEHTATLLPSGKVLIAGGSLANATGGGVWVWDAELYDPVTGTFSATGAVHTWWPQGATLLPDGRVLLVGGNGGSGAETYDPATGQFTVAGSLLVGNRVGSAMTLLPNGLVLVAGGQSNTSAELYDPSTRSFRATGSMAQARSGASATVLPNGLVLVTDTGPGAEIYNPATGQFTHSSDTTYGRASSTLLPNGFVLVTNYFRNAELYIP